MRADLVRSDDPLGLTTARRADRVLVLPARVVLVDVHLIVRLVLLVFALALRRGRLGVRRFSVRAVDVHLDFAVDLAALGERLRFETGIAEDVRALDAEGAMCALLLGDEGELEHFGVPFFAETVSVAVSRKTREQKRRGGQSIQNLPLKAIPPQT